MKKIILILILLIFVTGCAQTKESPAIQNEQPQEETAPVQEKPAQEPIMEQAAEQKQETIQEPLKETKLTNPLDVPRVNTAAPIILYPGAEVEHVPALCYLGAFAMIAIYDNPSLDISDIIAYSGVGSNANTDIEGIGNGFREKAIINAAENLGYDYFLAAKSGGLFDSMMARFKSSAAEVKSFKDEEEALSYIKSVIDSGKPVEVHLDTYYVIDDFRKISESWRRDWDKGHYSHFMVVTGYDNENVYINDPTDSDLTIKDIKVPVNNFLDAWENGDKVMGAQLGPYWMLYIKGKEKGKSTKEIIEWNYEISANAASKIKAAKKGSNGELGVGRKQFGIFLERNNYKEAGKLYKEAAEIYLKDPEDSASYKEIADKEEQARGLLK